jgi:hypothetical protein
MKILFRAKPTPYLKVKDISFILNRASLAPCFLMGSDSPTIPETIRDTNARFENGKAVHVVSQEQEVNSSRSTCGPCSSQDPSADSILFAKRRSGALPRGHGAQLCARRRVMRAKNKGSQRDPFATRVRSARWRGC